MTQPEATLDTADASITTPPPKLDNSLERGVMRDQARLATRLLRRAAAPERRHLIIATLWLILAAAFEVVGPLLGKALIDDHLPALVDAHARFGAHGASPEDSAIPCRLDK